MMSVLLSMSPTSGFVSRSCWTWGLDRMSCLVIWGLEVDRVLCTRGLRRTQRIISGSDNSCFSICCWRAGKKPGPLFVRPRLSSPSTVGTEADRWYRRIATNVKYKCLILAKAERKVSVFCCSHPDREERWEMVWAYRGQSPEHLWDRTGLCLRLGHWWMQLRNAEAWEEETQPESRPSGVLLEKIRKLCVRVLDQTLNRRLKTGTSKVSKTEQALWWCIVCWFDVWPVTYGPYIFHYVKLTVRVVIHQTEMKLKMQVFSRVTAVADFICQCWF